MRSSKLLYPLLEDLAAHEPVELLMQAVLPLEGGCQAHPERGGEHLRYVPVPCCREVVDLIEDYQAKPVSQLIGVDVGRIVGGDGQGFDLPFAAAQYPHLGLELLLKPGAPLGHQIEGWSHHQRGGVQLGDGFYPHEGLAASGGEDNYAAAVVGGPCIQGLALVVSQYRAALKLGTWQQIEDLVIEFEAGSLQKIEYIPVIKSHGSIASGSLIPGGIRDADVSLDTDCALVKGELHGLLFAFDQWSGIR